jgi:hypothetical protein
MRQGPSTKRQRGGRSNGRRPNFARSNTYDSNGPDVKIRGSAVQVLEKYQSLARDAVASGDRVAAENFLQHAEHYYRLLHPHGGSPAQGDGLNGGQGGGRQGSGGRHQDQQNQGNGKPDPDSVTV